MTLIVNLYGQPGAGKSTSATGAFSLLKLAGVNCEYVAEAAKELTFEARHLALSCQPYVFGEQLLRIERLRGKVDVVVTDSPLLLSRFYGEKYTDYPDSFYDYVTEQSLMFGGANYFIRRVKGYNPKGRNQSEAESDRIATEMQAMLLKLGVPFTALDGDAMAPRIIADHVLNKLEQKRAV